MKLTLHSKQQILHIETKPFAGGGEGNLHRILEPKELRSYVVKIYHKDKRSPLREQKMRYLLQHPPHQIQGENQHPPVVWPIDLVYDGKEMMGFLMPFVRGEKLEILCTPKLPRKVQDTWKRFAFGSPDSIQLRLRLCFNIATALYQVHSTERYVLVDLKPDNVVIQPNGLVSLVDMDSVEVVEDDRVLFPAPVATPEYSPPEHYHPRSHQSGIDTSWDNFSMAAIFYKLLLGIHPFAASALPPYDKAVGLQDMIQHGLFAHSSTRSKLLQTIPPLHEQFHYLDRGLKELFLCCFEDGHLNPMLRPTAADWCLHFFNSIEHSEEERERFGSAIFAKTRKLGIKLTLPSKAVLLRAYRGVAIEAAIPSGIPLVQQPDSDLVLTIPEPKQNELIPLKVSNPMNLIIVIPLFFILFSYIGLFAFLVLPFLTILIALVLYYSVGKSKDKEAVKKSKKELFKEFSKVKKEALQLRNRLLKAMPTPFPNTQEVIEKIKRELEKTAQFISNRDPEVAELESRAEVDFNNIEQKYWKQAFNHPWVSFLDPQKFNTLFLMYQYFHNEEKKKIRQLHQNFVWENHLEGYQDQKNAVKTKYAELSQELRKKTVDKIAEYQELGKQDIKEYWELVEMEADIHAYYYQKLLPAEAGRYGKEIHEWLTMQHFDSILQIKKFNNSAALIYLKDDRIIHLTPWIDKIPTIVDQFKKWKKAVDNTILDYNKIVQDTNAKVRVTKENLETAYNKELKQLQDKAELELRYIRRQVEQTILQPQIATVHAEYSEVLGFLKNLISRQDAEQDSLISRVQKQYKDLLAICQNRMKEVDAFRKEEEERFRRQIEQIFPADLRKDLQQYILHQSNMDNTKARLENVAFTLKRFYCQRPSFWNWLLGRK